MSDYRVSYSVDGVNLNDAAGRWFLNPGTRRRSLPAVRTTNVNTPGRHGDAFIPGDTYDVSSLILAVTVTASNAAGVMLDGSAGRAQVEENLEFVSALFADTARLFRVEHHTAPGVSRVAYGRVSAGSEPELVGIEALEYRLHFVVEIPAVFWSDGAGPQLAEGAAPTASGSLFLPALNGGSAPITDAIIRFKGPFNGKATVTDSRSGTGLSWQGTLAASTYLYLNAVSLRAHTSASATAWTSGTDVSAGLDYPPAGPLQLVPSVVAEGVSHGLRYALGYSLPAANVSPNAVAVRAERKFI